MYAPFCHDEEMKDCFNPHMSPEDVNRISMLGLAHVGDGVYELLVRSMLCTDGHQAIQDLHRTTVRYVNAPAQAKAMEKLLPLLSEEENAIYRRGRNAKVHGVPQNASVAEYHSATGLEALFGRLYLLGRRDRISELFAAIMEE